MYLEQVFQQHVCAMAQEINNLAVKIRIMERNYCFSECHIHHCTTTLGDAMQGISLPMKKAECLIHDRERERERNE